MESSASSDESLRSEESHPNYAERIAPQIAEAVRNLARGYRTDGSGRVAGGIEGVDFPAQVTPLWSLGPEKDVINIDDKPSDQGEDNPDEEDEGVEAEGGDEKGFSGEKAMDEENPAISTSHPEGRVETMGESSSQPPKKPKRKIVL